MAPSTFGGQSEFYYSGNKEYGMGYAPSDYPPMPAYDQGYGGHHGGDPYNHYNPSAGTLPDEQPYDDNDYGSTANLTMSAAPIAYPDRGNMISPRPQYGYQQQQHTDLYAYGNDPHAAYRGQSPGPNAAYSQDGHVPMYRGQSPGPGAAYSTDGHVPMYRGQSPGPAAAYGTDGHAAAYRSASPGPNVAYGHAYGGEPAYDNQQYGRQPTHGGQYQQHAQQGYGYPAQHGGNDGYDYGAGQAHAM